MTKHAEVTNEDRAQIEAIASSHKRDANDFIVGIGEIQQYLRDNIEAPGLFKFVSRIVGGTMQDCTVAEGLAAGQIYLDLNQTTLGIPIAGLTSSDDRADDDID